MALAVFLSPVWQADQQDAETVGAKVSDRQPIDPLPCLSLKARPAHYRDHIGSSGFRMTQHCVLQKVYEPVLFKIVPVTCGFHRQRGIERMRLKGQNRPSVRITHRQIHRDDLVIPC